MLLSKSSDYRDHHRVLTAGNLRALAFFALQTTERLANSATQLVMDSTYGTNGVFYAGSEAGSLAWGSEAKASW